jgi:hemerythrin-like domain-containing protein
LKTLEKELEKWQNINTQGQNAVSKELALYRQLMTRDISNSKEVIIAFMQIKEREIRALELRTGRVR